MNPILQALFGPMGGVIGMGDGRPNNSTSDLQALQKAFADARAQKQGPQANPSAPSVPALGGLGNFPSTPTQPNTMLQTAQNYMANRPAPPPSSFDAQAQSLAGRAMQPSVPLGAPAATPPTPPVPSPMSGVPMPQPRPGGAVASLPTGAAVPGASGPTSVNGAPLPTPPSSFGGPAPTTMGQRFASAHPQTASLFNIGQTVPGAVGPTSLNGAPLQPAPVRGPDLINKMMSYLNNKATG